MRRLMTKRRAARVAGPAAIRAFAAAGGTARLLVL